MDGVGWWGTVIEMSLMDTMEAARAELGQQPTFARIHGSVCLDTPRPPPGSLERARSPTPPLFAPPSPLPSVTPRLYPWASVSNRGARISVAHIVMPAVNPAYRVTQARHALWLGRY
ncbi:hypothetical protein OH76DRAFT_1483336 [Lentinus brumalis]|uniref:Uncharacterized protein n=1 Tax=Lentinus brumalis TaxID=2498619 RepID=A0A371D9C1_9APHY|nr:hypothetical protein OH76DRAFT_1483336 [Polyporus brumalis]